VRTICQLPVYFSLLARAIQSEKTTHALLMFPQLENKQVLYYRVPKKRGYTLAFFFCFDDPSDEYEFAYSFPYTYSDLQRFLCRKDLAHGGGAGRIDASTTDNSTSAQQPIEASPPRSTSRFVYRRELLCRTPMQRYL
jgi:hypothetical protein